MADESQQTSRLSAAEIFERVTSGAEEEIARPPHNLALSAVAAGLTMGLSGTGVALLLSVLGSDRVGESVAYLGYPLGFLIVILGRQQLFTENTLFPVALVLDRKGGFFGKTARLWGIVLLANLVGALLFALLAAKTPAFTGDQLRELVTLGSDAGSRGFGQVFWTAVVAGWLIALVAWLVTASTDTVGQVLVIVLLTYFVGVGHFAHSIAGSTEVLTAVVAGGLPLADGLLWLVAAVLGNALGGVVMVTLFNYGQVRAGSAESGDDPGQAQDPQEQGSDRGDRPGATRPAAA